MLPFLPPKAMTLPQAAVTSDIKMADGKPAIDLTTNATAMFVVLTTAANGRFSDNAFLLEKGAAKRVWFEVWDDAADAAATAMAELKAGLRVEHLQQMTVPPAPPAPPPAPLPPCPQAGCAGCGGCKWPYENATLPQPSLPITGQETATVVACEAKCAAQGGCVGFTYSGGTCFFYAHVSGTFSHDRPTVQWHPKPASGA